MTTALTGSLGWTGLHPVQLGGPPLISTWDRSLASTALPLLAHAYANDGTVLGTFGILNRPSIKATLANGGYEQVTLDVSAAQSGALYGLAVYGAGTYGGLTINLALGNIIRLTELGGPFRGFIYSGIIESFPDVRSQSGTSHQIVLTPFGAELTRVATQLVYTTAVDIAQAVRDAVALTQHCSCDQVSVPAATGFPLVSTSGAAVDFRGQKVTQVLDTCRSIAGPTWFWHCDELGRVWFQPQGSGAVYTLMAGQHYEERTSNGGDIQSRINQVPAVGGVPPGGSANVQAVANGSSQTAIGVRTLDPPIQAPGITDQITLTAIAAGILGTLDQTWTRVALRALPTFTPRVHGSQPGGATVRYWEPTRNPLPESGVGAGYVGPFIGQSVEHDGLHQQIEAGNIPVTSQTDVDNMVQSLLSRAASNAFLNAPALLNQLDQVVSGSFQTEAGASPWFVAIMAEYGHVFGAGPPFASFTTTTPTLVTVNGSSASVTFTLPRQTRVLAMHSVLASVSGDVGLVDLFLDGVNQTPAKGSHIVFGPGNAVTTGMAYYSDTLGAGSHTVELRAYTQTGGGPNLTIDTFALTVWQLGA